MVSVINILWLSVKWNYPSDTSRHLSIDLPFFCFEGQRTTDSSRWVANRLPQKIINCNQATDCGFCIICIVLFMINLNWKILRRLTYCLMLYHFSWMLLIILKGLIYGFFNIRLRSRFSRLKGLKLLLVQNQISNIHS